MHTRQYRWLEKSDSEIHYQASRMHAGGGLVTLVAKLPRVGCSSCTCTANTKQYPLPLERILGLAMLLQVSSRGCLGLSPILSLSRLAPAAHGSERGSRNRSSILSRLFRPRSTPVASCPFVPRSFVLREFLHHGTRDSQSSPNAKTFDRLPKECSV